jgi:hypothetical protein
LSSVISCDHFQAQFFRQELLVLWQEEEWVILAHFSSQIDISLDVVDLPSIFLQIFVHFQSSGIVHLDVDALLFPLEWLEYPAEVLLTEYLVEDDLEHVHVTRFTFWAFDQGE